MLSLTHLGGFGVAASADNDAFTKILLHFPGADTSTTFTDINAGGAAHTWTAAGNAQIDDAQSVFGGTSGLFDGTGDYISTPDHADFTLGSGNWTLDFRIRSSNLTGTHFICGQSDSGAVDATISVGAQTIGGDLGLVARIGSTTYTVDSANVTNIAVVVDTWYHIALVRSGNTIHSFKDGVSQGTITVSGAVNDSANAYSIGRIGELTTSTFAGWIDEFRLSVGIARWTANFTPPAVAYF